MRRLITPVLFAAALVAAALPVACKKQPGGAADSPEINVGEYGSMSGSEATFGQSTHKGISLAFDQINAAGGVLGKKLVDHLEDDQGNQDEAISVVKKLINRDNVVAVLGEVASSLSRSAGPVCENAKIPMISPSSTSPDVTKDKNYVFRVCFTDDFQGPVGARFALKKGWKKVAVLTAANSDYSKNLSRFFKEAFTQGGGTLAADESYRQGNDKDFKAQLTRIAAGNPDAVYLPGYYTEVVLVLNQARNELGMKMPFFGGDGWDSDAVRNAGAVTDGCFFSNHYSPDDPRPSVQDFVKAYQAKFNGEIPDAMAITGYDAARVLADAIKRAGSAAPDKIRDAIAATKDFPGAGGPITIDDQHNARKAIVVVELRGGQTHIAESIEP